MLASDRELEQAKRLEDYWDARCGSYARTSLGVDGTKHGGPGGTYKEINERRAQKNRDFYSELIHDITATKDIATWRLERLLKDFKRLKP